MKQNKGGKRFTESKGQTGSCSLDLALGADLQRKRQRESLSTFPTVNFLPLNPLTTLPLQISGKPQSHSAIPPRPHRPTPWPRYV